MSSNSHLPHWTVLPLGEFNGMSCQILVSHCRVLPLGEFTVTIPEPHATLQGAVAWRNQCHDRAPHCRIPSAILKIVFRHILFFLMQFRLWRAAAFVSSPIHLFYSSYRPSAEHKARKHAVKPHNDELTEEQRLATLGLLSVIKLTKEKEKNET